MIDLLPLMSRRSPLHRSFNLKAGMNDCFQESTQSSSLRAVSEAFLLNQKGGQERTLFSTLAKA
jgi:hypothetical protein